jgi:hypothetical protein
MTNNNSFLLFRNIIKKLFSDNHKLKHFMTCGHKTIVLYLLGLGLGVENKIIKNLF